MKQIYGLLIGLAILLTQPANAESLRCSGDIVEIGNAKVDVYRKCGEPVLKDSFCETKTIKVKQTDGTYNVIDRCDYIDVWTYNPGKGQFWTNLYFSEGRLREMRYGDRIE